MLSDSRFAMKSASMGLFLWSSFLSTIIGATTTLLTTEKVDWSVDVPCFDMNYVERYNAPVGCITKRCGRRVVDGLFAPTDIDKLLAIAEKGLSTRPKNLGGPTIVDINTGYIRDSKGLDNLFMKNNVIYSEDDFTTYGDIIRRLRIAVMDHFELSDLYFTTPTFITRLDGNESWQPEGIHDEYWHVHADRNNTEHYHYSGLLYLSNYNQDFTGGLLKFFSANNPDIEEQIVQPAAGRVIMFTSGPENPHVVERVTSGERFVLSFWFTCNVAREFEIFLDGKSHIAFSEKTKAKLVQQHKQQQQQQQQQRQSNQQEL